MTYFRLTLMGPTNSFLLNAYLQEDPAGIFVMPADLDVVIRVEIPDPLDQSKQRTIFTETVPAGSVIQGTRYRYTGGAGIHDLEFSRQTENSIYMYLEVQKVYFLYDLKKLECWPRCPETVPDDPELASSCAGCYSGTPLTPGEYRAYYILPIPSYTITVTVGDYSWKGGGNLTPGDYNEHYQELLQTSGN